LIPPPPDRGTLAERLNFLFTHAHPRFRGPYSSTEVAATINGSREAAVDAGYLDRVRNGEELEPPWPLMQTLAKFFGVPITYFSDREVATQVNEGVALLAALRDEDVRRIVVRLIADDLPPEVLASVDSLIGQAQPSPTAPPAQPTPGAPSPTA